MNTETIKKIKKAIRNVPDFPIPGIQFKDLTTLFVNNKLLEKTVDLLYEYYKDKGITKVVGIESRGYIVGGILAYKLGAGFVLIRKPGKLPAETIKKEYALEYGTNAIEIHKDAVNENDVVLVHDDLLATGGTANAAIDLLSELNVKKISVNFIVELDFLNGREKLKNTSDIFSLIHY